MLACTKLRTYYLLYRVTQRIYSLKYLNPRIAGDILLPGKFMITQLNSTHSCLLNSKPETGSFTWVKICPSSTC